MFRISLVLKKEDRFIVKKDYFNNDYYYGFWEIFTAEKFDVSSVCGYIKENYPVFIGVNLLKVSYVTQVVNPETVYIFCLADISKEHIHSKEDYCIVSEEELKELNMIYPDAICRDILSKQEKSLSEREKEILIAADKIFNINENAARADAFIALMENRIDENGFEGYIKERIKAYRYGMPDFGFNSDMHLCIWKQRKDRWSFSNNQ